MLAWCSRIGVPLVGAALFLSGGAQAELGGPLSSVRADSGRMGMRMASVAMPRYTRHALTTIAG